MATSGNVSVVATKHDTLKFSWWVDHTSIEYNYTTIGWKLELIAGSYGYISSSASKNWAVSVNGTYYSGTNTIGIANNATKALASGYTQISHNADGSKSFSFSFSQQFDITFSGSKIGTVSGSGNGTLNSIPRQATLTAAPDFNDEQNPTINYTNPAGNAVAALDACISFTGSLDDIGYRAVSKTGSSYTFNLTADERKKLRQWVTAGSTSREVTFFLRTNIGGAYYWSTIKKTVTIINDTPTLSSTVEITDDLTKELTGNSNTIIKNVSTVNYAINATAYKEAAINGQWVLNNGVYKYENTGTFTNLESGYFLFAASDNRGRHIRAGVNKNFVDYVKLTCNADIKIALTSEELATVTIKIYGNYFNNTFGAITNDIALAYRYKTESGDYGEWVHPTASLTPTFSGNTYELTATIENLDYRNAYTIQCAASDRIAYIESVERTIKAVPVFDWGENDFNFNVPVKIQGREYGKNRLLADTWAFMHGTQTVYLNEPISAQPHGIVLVFCYYDENAHSNGGPYSDLHSFFISKEQVALFGSASFHSFLMAPTYFTAFTQKLLYIGDKTITGHDYNGISSGNVVNTQFVLKYVIGV